MGSRDPRLVYFASTRFPGVYAVSDGFRVFVVTPDTVVESDDFAASEEENYRFGREARLHRHGWCPPDVWRRVVSDVEWLFASVLLAPCLASFGAAVDSSVH